MTELTAVWMLGCVCGFFMGVTVAGRRRPKPLSLKEQALEELREISIDPESGTTYSALETIRRAIESLPS